MKIAIFGRWSDNTDIATLADFLGYLKERHIDFTLLHTYHSTLLERYPQMFHGLTFSTFHEAKEIRDCRVMYSLGGDGTVLEAVRFVGSMSKPILGVNFGRLGYLASITKEELIPATEELLRDMYRIDERSLLSVVSNPSGLFVGDNFGVNDLTIHKANTNEMITVHTYINGELLNSYWGDGLIVATPTGSTAYSLSCGGPIIFPRSGTFAITPVAPHSLTVRPVVIPDDWVVSFEIESRSGEVLVALDTRTEMVETHTSIAVRRADFKARLLRMSTTKYINNLRDSLMWGKDQRNG
ncbi:MAG: NAD kinase [Bacteroidota bacterium]